MNFSDRRLKVTIGDNTLNPDGILTIKNLFEHHKLHIPEIFSWELVNRQGSLAKRLKKIVNNIKWNYLNDYISQLIDQHGNPIRDIYFKATKSDW